MTRPLVLALSSLVLLGNSNCAGHRPPWDVEFYVGDTHKLALVRCTAEDPDTKECTKWDEMKPNDPRFDEMIAMHRSAIQKLEEEVLSRCERWKE